MPGQATHTIETDRRPPRFTKQNFDNYDKAIRLRPMRTQAVLASPEHIVAKHAPVLDSKHSLVSQCNIM